MLNKISRGSYYSIERLSSDLFLSIRHDKAVAYHLDMQKKRIDKVFQSNEFKNMSNAVCTFNKKYWLFANTGGKCQIYDAESNVTIDTFHLKSEPNRNDFLGLHNGFLFVDKDRTLNFYDCQMQSKVKMSEFQNIAAIVLRNGQIHIFQISLNPQHDISESTVKTLPCCMDIPCVIHNLKQTFEQAVGDNIAFDRQLNDLLSVSKVPKGKGYSSELFRFSFEKDTWERLFSLDGIRQKEDGYYVNCAVDFEQQLAFLLFSDTILSIDLNELTILKKGKIQYCSDIEWVDDRQLLVATWEGLYLMSLER